MRSVWLGLLVAVACGNGASDHPALPPDATGATSSGGTRGSSGSKSTGDAGAAGEGATSNSSGSSSVEGGAGNAGGETDAAAGETFEAAGAPPVFPSGVCKPNMMLATAQTQDVGVADATLLAMTGDELSVAFTTGSADTLALHVADRASAQAAFTEVSVTVPDDYEAASGVTLAADGLTLVLVSKDHSGLGALERAKRGDDFAGEIDTAPFAKINSLKAMSGDSIGWPLLSNDGKSLYYVSYNGLAYTLQSKLGSDGVVFDYGAPIAGDESLLGGKAGAYKLLSGIAADDRAIFFFDEASKHSMALFRSRPGAPFYDPVDLGDRRGASPNAACNRVYSSAAGDVVVQNVK